MKCGYLDAQLIALCTQCVLFWCKKVCKKTTIVKCRFPTPEICVEREKLET
jgi:hypothetical protein